MKKSKQVGLFLIGLFLLSLALRWFFAFSFTHFSGDGAYFHLRHITYLLEHYQPLFFDSFSWGGRTVLYPPLFHILMSVFSFGNVFLLKALPELFISCLTFVTYLLGYELTRDKWAAAWGAALACFFPLLFSSTVNSLSLHSFFLPAFFLLLYFTLRLHLSSWYLYGFVFLTFLVGLLSPLSVLFILTTLIYLFLLSGEATSLASVKKEALVFSSLFIVLFLFLVYKRAFLAYGVSTLYYNIPATLLANTFSKVSALGFFVDVGLLPLLFGTFGLYVGVFYNKKKPALLLSSLILSVFLLLTLRLFSFTEGLLFLGVALGIMSSVALQTLFVYFKKTRVAGMLRYKYQLLFILFCVFSLYPTFASLDDVSTIEDSYVASLQTLAEVSDDDDVILGSVYDGHVIMYFTQRATVVDSSFLLAPSVLERVDDVAAIYTTDSEQVALDLIEKYSIDYIVMSDSVRQLYGTSSLFKRSGCFSLQEGYYAVRC